MASYLVFNPEIAVVLVAISLVAMLVVLVLILLVVSVSLVWVAISLSTPVLHVAKPDYRPSSVVMSDCWLRYPLRW